MNEHVVVLTELVEFLRRLAPLELAEEWDNVGLLVGDSQASVRSVMTCLTLTPEVAEEAVTEQADLIVSHHPVLFRATKRLTADEPEGATLLKLIRAGIAVYSPHTSYDSCREGINQQLAEWFGLEEIEPLRVLPCEEEAEETTGRPVGIGRCGRLPEPTPLAELVQTVKQVLNVARLWYVGDGAQVVERLGIACGAAAEFAKDALAKGCDVFLTGEARFHSCLEAKALGLAMILPGHYATERPAVERLAERLAQQFPGLKVWASRAEQDPLRWA